MPIEPKGFSGELIAAGDRLPGEVDTERTLQLMDAPLPNIGAPAARALAEAGVLNLDDAERVGLDHLAALHGVGPKAIRLLKAALEQ